MLPVSAVLCPVKSELIAVSMSLSIPMCLSEMGYFTEILNRDKYMDEYIHMNTYIYTHILYTHIQQHTQRKRGVVQRPCGRKLVGRKDPSLAQYTMVEIRGGHWGTRLKERACPETGEWLNRLGHPGLGLNYPKGSSQSS